MKLFSMVLVLLVGVIIVSGCTQYGTQQPKTTQIAPTGEVVKETIQTVSTGEVKEFTMMAKKWDFSPSTITVNKGDTVKLHIKSIDGTHGFGLSAFGINENLEPGKTVNVEFVADKTGTFTFACTVFCGSGHSGMKGQLIVK